MFFSRNKKYNRFDEPIYLKEPRLRKRKMLIFAILIFIPAFYYGTSAYFDYYEKQQYIKAYYEDVAKRPKGGQYSYEDDIKKFGYYYDLRLASGDRICFEFPCKKDFIYIDYKKSQYEGINSMDSYWFFVNIEDDKKEKAKLHSASWIWACLDKMATDSPHEFNNCVVESFRTNSAKADYEYIKKRKALRIKTIEKKMEILKKAINIKGKRYSTPRLSKSYVYDSVNKSFNRVKMDFDRVLSYWEMKMK